MTHPDNAITPPVHRASLGKRMLIGTGIGLLLISVFLLGVDQADPAWGKLWMIKPLLMVPLAGAGAGLASYLMDDLRSRDGWKKALAMILTVIVYIIAFWLGAVLGLDGTLWN